MARPKRLPVAVSEDEFFIIIKQCRKETHKIAFLLAFGSGLRISEVLKLEPKDINMQEKKMFLREAKGGKDRIVPVPKGFKQKHLKLLPMKIGCRALEMAFRKYCDETGILKDKPGIHFHSLRHGFATKCIEGGMKVPLLQMLLGHSKIDTTMIYVHLNPKDALNAYEEVF